MSAPVWTLEYALPFVRILGDQLRAKGWGVALGGSVLARGESMKDLDIILMPHGTQACDVDCLRFLLKSLGFELVKEAWEVKRDWLDEHGSRDTKHVEIWEFEGKRVDFFFLR